MLYKRHRERERERDRERKEMKGREREKRRWREMVGEEILQMNTPVQTSINRDKCIDRG